MPGMCRALTRLVRAAAAPFLLVSMCAQPLQAQGAHGDNAHPGASMPSLSQYTYDRWDDRAGLQQQYIQAIAQTTDGYLWLGTTDGLTRFDGHRFVHFDGRTHPVLDFAYFWALISDRDGGLWGGTEFGGVFHMKSGEFTTFGTEQGLPADFVMNLLQDRLGRVWVGTHKGLARIADGQVTAFVQPELRGNIWTTAMDLSGVVWISTQHGLGTMSGDRFIPLSDSIGMPIRAPRLEASARGGMWVMSAGKLTYRGRGGVEPMSGDLRPLIGAIWSMREDAVGGLWLSGDSGIARRSGGTVQVMSRSNGPPSGVGALLFDREGSLWGGTTGDGLVRVRATPIVPLGPPEGLRGKMSSVLMQDSMGAIWVGTYYGGVNVVTRDTTVTMDPPGGHLATYSVFGLAETRDGSVWVATGLGASRFRNGRVDVFRADVFPEQVRKFAEDDRGRLWVGTNQGIRTFSDGPVRRVTAAGGLVNDMVVDMLASSDGSMWVATVGGVSRIRGDSITNFVGTRFLPDDIVNVLYEDSRGVMWAGTRKGLVRFDNGSVFQYTGASGLCNVGVYSIVEDASHRLWLGGAGGLFYLSRADLDAYAAGTLPQLTCTMYDRVAGLRHPEVNGNAVRANDGRLWFPTSDGVAIVDPHSLATLLSPPSVVIEEVTAGGRVYDRGPLALPQGTRTFAVHYTAMSFIGSDRIRFRYILDGVDDTWVDAGTDRTAIYRDVPSGHHTFRVVASRGGGEWTEAAAGLEMFFKPYFYETAWFRVGASILLVAGLILMYRRRLAGWKQNLDSHQQAERRYRDAFENTNDAIILTDMKGCVTDMNATAVRVTGYELSDLAGQHVNSLLAGIEQANGSASMFTGAAKPLSIRARGGGDVPVDVSTYVVDVGAGPIGIQLVARDLRERNLLAEQLRQSQRMEAVGHLAAGVAHDFNNLLTVIRGNGALLLERPNLASNRAHVLEILSASDRAAQLTQQLLMFGKQEVVQARAIDLNDVLMGLDPLIRRLLPSNVEMELTPCPSAATVFADSGHMEQVLMNLALNARDAMPDGGRLEIGISRDAETVTMRVADTGSGMSEDVQRHIYDPFFTTKEQGKGTGLGLFTIYNVIVQSRGEIHCSSVPGEGTVFTVTLACHAAGAAVAPREPPAGPVGNRKAATILVAEDEPSVRNVVMRILRRRGHTLIEASNGREALELAAQHDGPIDLLLTDMMMPELGGLVLHQLLSADRPDIPVLFMSGYTNDQAVRSGSFPQNGSFIGKPFTADELITAVNQALDVRRTE